MAKKKRGKPRSTEAWREFERAVARIETVLQQDGARVKSPDKILDKAGKEYREVDASIRTKAGTADILITLECRRRSRTEDVTWIEQLATKKQNIGAHLTIAVALSGFSAAAHRVAANSGIVLRTFSELDDTDVQGWVKFNGMQLFRVDCRVRITRIFFAPADLSAKEIENVTGRLSNTIAGAGGYATGVFVRDDIRKVTSVNDLIHELESAGAIEKCMRAADSSAESWSIVASYAKQNLRLLSSPRRLLVAKIVFTLNVQPTDVSRVTRERFGQYRGEAASPRETAEIVMPGDGFEVAFSIQRELGHNEITSALTVLHEETGDLQVVEHRRVMLAPRAPDQVPGDASIHIDPGVPPS